MIDPPITQEEWVSDNHKTKIILISKIDAAEHESDRGPVLNFLQSAMDRVKKAFKHESYFTDGDLYQEVKENTFGIPERSSRASSLLRRPIDSGFLS
ncbi:hypothetical protein ACTXT7_002299 [Hymenolepis weldensis]